MADNAPENKGFFGRMASGMKYIFTGRNDFFGPGLPLPTAIPAEAAREVGLVGRQFDFTSWVNLQRYPRAEEAITFQMLRSLAENLDILRIVIETRKDQMANLPWKIVAREGEKVPKSRLKELNAFFKRPDREHTWSIWLRTLLDDLFVIDALTIYPRRARSGKLFSLDYVDGATIKRVIDETGRTPEPPNPAYQQIIKGQIASEYTWDELVYRPRNLRTYKFYGFSPVEQIMLTVNIALRRAIHQLNYYTEGNVPEALCGVPENWNVEQIKQFQTYFDALLAGNSALRRRLIFVHGGMKPTFTRDMSLKDEMDEWLARVVCYCFSLPPTPFIRQMNRATAETSQETAIEEGLQPLMDYVKELLDEILEFQMDSPDCELSWEQEKSVDIKVQADVDKIYIDAGVQTAKQIAEARGMEWIEPEVKPEPANITEQVQPDGSQTAQGGGGDSQSVQSKGGEIPAKGGPRQDQKLEKADKPEGKRLAPIPFERTAVRKAMKKLRKTLGAFLAGQAKIISDQLSSAYEAFQKAEKKSPLDGAIDDLDFDGWEILWAPMRDNLEAIYEDTALEALGQVGITDEGITDLVMEKAVEYARNRAAELVGMKYVDGELVENPNAVWAITESTRDMLRQAVTSSLETGPSPQALADSIVQSAAFSEARAEMIARTELAMAHSEGALEGYKEARGTGIAVYKEWLDSDGCDECSQNADAGVIDLDDTFPSGDDAPPAHPNCRCAIAPVVVSNEDVEEGEDPFK
jgi:SPP1 gp7 family putative phage head morphogenesis protein